MKLFKVISSSGELSRRKSIDAIKEGMVTVNGQLILDPFNDVVAKDDIRLDNKKIKHNNPILLGVSFGGIIVQELEKIINVKKLIIVSSVKSHKEYPILYKIARDYQLNNALPFGMFDNFIKFSLKLNINKLYKRIDLAERYLTERNEIYLEWAVWSLLNWKQEKYRPDLIHIHGDKDKVFPIENISNCIKIKGGRHEMIILKAKWFNENLPSLIEN